MYIANVVYAHSLGHYTVVMETCLRIDLGLGGEVESVLIIRNEVKEEGGDDLVRGRQKLMPCHTYIHLYTHTPVSPTKDVEASKYKVEGA